MTILRTTFRELRLLIADWIERWKMSCVFSILFAAIGRMVVTGSDYGKSSYGVYQVTEDYEFYLPETSEGIHVSGSKITGPGTHVVAYCSILQGVHEIVEIITKPLTEITHYPERGNQRYEAALESCSKQIVSESVEDIPLPMSKLIRENSCTEKNIIDLAYQGKIKVIGKFSCFVPTGAISPVIVDANRPLSIKNFLDGRKMLKREGKLASKKKDASEITNIPVMLMEDLAEKIQLLKFVKGIEDPTDQTVMVWFQGNLHLLHRRPSKYPTNNQWYPLTLIGHELRNAPLIAKFVIKSFGQIDEFTRKMKQFRTSFVRDDLNIEMEANKIKMMSLENYYRMPRYFIGIPGYVDTPDFRRRFDIYTQENPDTSLSVKDYPNCPPRYYQYAKIDNLANTIFAEFIKLPSQFNDGLRTAKFTEMHGFGEMCAPWDRAEHSMYRSTSFVFTP